MWETCLNPDCKWYSMYFTKWRSIFDIITWVLLSLSLGIPIAKANRSTTVDC